MNERVEIEREVRSYHGEVWSPKKVLVAFFLWMLILIIAFITIPYFELNPIESIFLSIFLVVIYSIVLFFLLESKIFRQVVKETERPIYTPQKLSEIVKTIERPVEVIKPVYVRTPQITKTVHVPVPAVKKKLNIPKYDYVGSSLTKVYHAKTCRLSKSIKNKYKVHNNSVSFFTSRKYKPCKVCILKKKKV